MAYAQYTVLEQINGNYTGALQYGLHSLRIAERMKNFIHICESYNVLVDIYREAGDFEQAIDNMRKAKSLLESKLNPVFEQEKDTVIAGHYVCYPCAAQLKFLKHSTGSIPQYNMEKRLRIYI